MALNSAIEVISRRSSTSDAIFSLTRHEIDQYLQAVDEIQRSIGSATAHDQIRAKSAIQIAMPRLADEMQNLLKIKGKSTNNQNSSTYTSTMTDSGSNSYVDDYNYSSALSVTVIEDLRSIVNRMNGAGYLRDCKEAYVSNRKHCVHSSYQKLQIQKLSSTDARILEWNTLEVIIKVWMKSAKICFRKIFKYEKQLCEKIFEDLSDNVDNDCFLEISNDYAIQLLEIAANLSCIRTASERLFGILELYKTFSELLPEINKLFSTNADQVVRKIAGAACNIIEKFEKDLSQHVPVDKIHSLCKYVMDYVYKLGQNKQVLMELCLCNPPLTPGVVINLTVVESQLQHKLPYHVMWIVMCLVSKLEEEAKMYKNGSDINFYLMNNFFYIVKKINGKAEVKEMIGDDCFEKVCSKFDQAKSDYLRLTFSKVSSILRDNNDNKSLQRRLKGFNGEFKKVQNNLERLRVPDFQLLKDIRASMEEMLVPAYASFLAELSASPRLMVDVKFSVEELKSAILGFFPSA